MNVFGKRARGWRKGKKRGVSPIIATILLVAITVVLAAVLYVLISGLTGHGNATPLGTAFGTGTATQQNGTGTGWCQAGHQCWEIGISAASGPTVSELSFSVKTSGGAGVSSARVTVVNLAQNGWAVYNMTTSAWTYGGTGISGSTPVSPTMELWVDSGATYKGTSVYGQGWTLTVYGSGSFTGSVGPSGLP